MDNAKDAPRFYPPWWRLVVGLVLGVGCRLLPVDTGAAVGIFLIAALCLNVLLDIVEAVHARR
jgi:hypothetical protein